LIDIHRFLIFLVGMQSLFLFPGSRTSWKLARSSIPSLGFVAKFIEDAIQVNYD